MQTDLFELPGTSEGSVKEGAEALNFLERHRFTFRLDQVLVIIIGMLMIYAFIFSFGVEAGKRFAWSELNAERAKREYMVKELRRKLMEKMFVPSPGAQPAKSNKVLTSDAKVAPAAASEKKNGDNTQIKQPELPVSTQPEGKYTIQILTYKTQSAAERALRDLSKQGLKGFVIPNGTNIHVCIDSFENHQKAKKALENLKSQGTIPSDAFVRMLP